MASPTNTPKSHDGPARGPKGSVGTDKFGSETAPTSAWNSTVTQAGPGPGQGDETATRGDANSPYPDRHSTVPTPDPGDGEAPYPQEIMFDVPQAVPFGGARGPGDIERIPHHQGGDYPVPEERSTVSPQGAGPGASGPRQEWPRDTTSDKFMDYAGSDGDDYRLGIPYSGDMPANKNWGMYGPENGGYGHSQDIGVVDLHNGSMNWDYPGRNPHGNMASGRGGERVLKVSPSPQACLRIGQRIGAPPKVPKPRAMRCWTRIETRLRRPSPTASSIRLPMRAPMGMSIPSRRT